MATALGKVRKDKLTSREKRFLNSYVKTLNITESYKIISSDASSEVASAAGSRLMGRIRTKAGFKTILTDAGLGKERVAGELLRMLSAKTKKYYKDKSLGEHDDNPTQMRAIELLADLLGLRKSALDVNHSGKIMHYDAVVYDAINGNGNGNGNGKSGSNGKSFSVPASLDG